MRLHLAFVACGLLLAGCQSAPPQVETRVISVPSSKAYRYIKPHPEDKLTKGTLKQIEIHNATHWRVKQKEKEANAKSND